MIKLDVDISVLIGDEIAPVAAIVLSYARIETLVAVIVLIAAEITLIFDFLSSMRKLVVLLAGPGPGERPSCSSNLRDVKHPTRATRAEQWWKSPHTLSGRSKHWLSPDDQEQEGDEHACHDKRETYFLIK